MRGLRRVRQAGVIESRWGIGGSALGRGSMDTDKGWGWWEGKWEGNGEQRLSHAGSITKGSD